MPEIMISEENWERLKEWAIPLEDTPNDALRKILDIAKQHLDCGQGGVEGKGQGDVGESHFSDTRSELIESRYEEEDTVIESELGSRLPRGQKVPNEKYYAPILLTLLGLGGSAPTSDVLDGVEMRMKHMFTGVDYQDRPSGGISRWKHTAHWARNTMVHKLGLLRGDSPHGVWELSEAGIIEARRLSVI